MNGKMATADTSWNTITDIIIIIIITEKKNKPKDNNNNNQFEMN